MFRRIPRSLFVLLMAHAIAGVVRADEPLTLRYKLEKGSQQIQRVKNETKTTQTINGNNIDTGITQTTIQVVTIDEALADGAAKLKTKTERLQATSQIPGAGEFKFDSQNTDRDKSSVLGAALIPLYERLVGAELQMEVTPRGAVRSLTGYAQLVGDLVKENPLVAQFAGGGSDNVAKLGAQGQWLILPEKAIKPGEKWDNPFEMELPGLGAIKGKETVTFLRIEQRDSQQFGHFSTSTDISFDLNLEVNGAKVTGKITTANSTGTAELNITAGKLVSQKASLTLTGELSVEVNNMNLPVQLSQTITTEQTILDKLPD